MPPIEKSAPSKLVALIRDMPRSDSRSFFAFKREFVIEKWSFSKLYALAEKFSRLLEEIGIEKGDCVVVWGTNCLALIAAHFGTLICGAVLVPLDPATDPQTVLKIVHRVRARLMVASKKVQTHFPDFPFVALETLEETLRHYHGATHQNLRVYESDLAQIVFTSGTTADPKGVAIRHRNIAALFPPIWKSISELRWVLKMIGSIRFLALLPLNHLYGQMLQLYIPLMIKASVIFPARMSTTFLFDTIKKEKIHVAVCVPRILEIFRDHIIHSLGQSGSKQRFDLKLRKAAKRHFVWRYLYFFNLHRQLNPCFVALIVGGARLDPNLYEFFRVLSFAVYQGYGLTETSPIVTVFNPLKDKPGSLGTVLGDQEVRIAPDGEILVRGPNVTEGYVDDPDQTAAAFQNGWLRTGDLGRLDADGTLYFLGRKKDVIVTPDGINIYPEDIELILNQQPGIRDSAVVFLKTNGKETLTAILLTELEASQAADAIRNANAILSSFQRIRRFYVWPGADFPRTALMKPQKRMLIEWVGSMGDRIPETTSSGVRGILSRMTGIDADQLDPSWTVGRDLGLSSLDRLELALKLESIYPVCAEDALLDERVTIGEIENMITAKPLPYRRINMPSVSQYTALAPLRFLLRNTVLFPLMWFFFRMEVTGREHLKRVKSPVIFVANHSSHLDTAVILKALPLGFRRRLIPAMNLDFFSAYFFPDKEHLLLRYGHALLYLIVKAFFPVYPFGARYFRRSFAHTGELVAKGYSPLIFPEGERTRTGDLLPFKDGIGYLAASIEVPIIPIRIKGTFELLPPGVRIPKQGCISVHIGKPCKISGDSPQAIAGQLGNILKRL